MRRIEIEARVLDILDVVTKGQPVEDDSVELKSIFIPADKAARRIAGHANAARGEPILWLIGVDEKSNSVIGADQVEFSDWWNQVSSRFSEVSPTPNLIAVRYQDKTVVALYMETDAAPFLTKPPNDTKVDYELPWRQGNSTISARRSDALRIIAPLVKVPQVELLSGEVSVSRATEKERKNEEEFVWSVSLDLYVVPPTPDLLTIPFHRCSLTVQIDGYDNPKEFEDIRLRAPSMGFPKTRSLSETVSSTQDELLLVGPGRTQLSAKGHTRAIAADMQSELSLQLKLQTAATDRPAIVDVTLPRKAKHDRHQARWAMNRPLIEIDRDGHMRRVEEE